MSNRTLTETVTYRGKELEVEFTSYAGFRGSQTEPPEPASIDIEKVVYQLKYAFHAPMCPSTVEVDLTDFLGEDDYAAIKELLNEKASDAATEREIDKAEAAEEYKRYGND